MKTTTTEAPLAAAEHHCAGHCRDRYNESLGECNEPGHRTTTVAKNGLGNVKMNASTNVAGNNRGRGVRLSKAAAAFTDSYEFLQ